MNMYHHIILLAVLPYLLCAGIKSLETIEVPLWIDKTADAFLQQFDASSENTELYHHRNPYEEGKTESNYAIYPRPSVGKRALAMFARWGSINSIGKNRPPIRSNSYESDNTNNRRMQGQPLRWG
ncbi:uncharacterized protein LOC130902082 [Diorhabda carinulata]|uniref:uncharacterized protein LOC130902082 n=1 Tax=Diorhabda carinulata TaxID=1163345 RepID=UPI0025A16FCF|nr:uncharacterized protein LOC130902082 [Diorhabda carinulata]